MELFYFSDFHRLPFAVSDVAHEEEVRVIAKGVGCYNLVCPAFEIVALLVVVFPCHGLAERVEIVVSVDFDKPFCFERVGCADAVVGDAEIDEDAEFDFIFRFLCLTFFIVYNFF